MEFSRSQRSKELRERFLVSLEAVERLLPSMRFGWWLVAACASFGIALARWKTNDAPDWNAPMIRTGEFAYWASFTSFTLVGLTAAYFFVPRRSIATARALSWPLCFLAVSYFGFGEPSALRWGTYAVVQLLVIREGWRALDGFGQLDDVAEEPWVKFSSRMRVRLARANEWVEFAKRERHRVLTHLAVGASAATLALALHSSVEIERPKEHVALFEEALRAGDVERVARLALPEHRDTVRAELKAHLDHFGQTSLRAQSSFAVCWYGEHRELCVKLPTNKGTIETAWSSVRGEWYLEGVR